MNKKVILDGKSYTGKGKWKLQQEYKKNVELLDEYQKAINDTTLNYSTQISRATHGMKLPKNIKSDKVLNQIKFRLQPAMQMVFFTRYNRFIKCFLLIFMEKNYQAPHPEGGISRGFRGLG